MVARRKRAEMAGVGGLLGGLWKSFYGFGWVFYRLLIKRVDLVSKKAVMVTGGAGCIGLVFGILGPVLNRSLPGLSPDEWLLMPGFAGWLPEVLIPLGPSKILITLGILAAFLAEATLVSEGSAKSRKKASLGKGLRAARRPARGFIYALIGGVLGYASGYLFPLAAGSTMGVGVALGGLLGLFGGAITQLVLNTLVGGSLGYAASYVFAAEIGAVAAVGAGLALGLLLGVLVASGVDKWVVELEKRKG